jgi:uncharacterized repeat protein (TIGR03803 family)
MKRDMMTVPRLGLSIAIASLALLTNFCETARSEFTVLHNFTPASDGRAPNGVSARIGSTLYGVAEYGAANGNGAVWSLDTTTSSFENLHDFSAASDGSTPVDLATDGSALFGTTSSGGSNNDGTIWQLLAGPFDNRRNLNGPLDGASARGVVIKDNHLYGVALAGGSGDGGTIWAMNLTNASFDNLHSFELASDGSKPVGRPVFSGNILYGTASSGGATNNGTIWSLDITTNAFTNLHDFTLATDGDLPFSDLILVSDVLYGTASNGGANGDGTLWSFNTTTATFTQLHDFDGAADGSGPGSLVQLGDHLVGTAATGGIASGGTIWSYNTLTGNLKTIHGFTSATDGSFPTGHLLVDGNSVYGGTLFGGSNAGGTLWSISVPEPGSATFALLASCALIVVRRRRNGDGG